MIFSKGTNDLHTFSLNGTNLEIVSEYKYLGVYFSKNNSFHSTKKHIAEQGTKALYSLLSKARTLQLPVNIQIDLFDKLVKPILLYGCEVWGFGNNDVIERVQLKFLKYILNAKKQHTKLHSLWRNRSIPLATRYKRKNNFILGKDKFT